VRVVVQRVSSASVRAGGATIAEIGWGLVVLVGVEREDTEFESEALARKVAKVQLFPRRSKSMARSLAEFGGAALVVSEVTLAADVLSAHRPSFLSVAPAKEAEAVYLHFAKRLQFHANVPVQIGRFGADMQVELVNDGPVTFVLTCAPGGAVGN